MSVQIGREARFGEPIAMHRHVIAFTPNWRVEMPASAQFVKAELSAEGNSIDVWYVRPVHSCTEIAKVMFHVVGTGQAIQWPGAKYVDTVTDGNGMAWHVFVREEEA